jgi:hypothetical protein
MALPLVLWSIAFMGGVVVLLAGIVGDWLDNESRAERGFIARQMALSGIALGLNPAVKPGDPLLTSGSPETEGYQVRLENEAARINPNFWVEQGSRPVFLKLFESWGADLQMGDAAIDSLLDWIDGDDLVNLKGAERGEYERVGRPGYPANRPLRHIREMEAVMNLSPILSQKESWQDYFTVWYSGKINIQHATPPILMELAGLTPAQVDSLIRMRVGQDGIQGTADDQKLGSIEDVASFLGAGGRQREALLNYFDTSGDVRRIESTGYCHGVKYKIVVVSDAGASGQIMSWEEK